MFLEKVKPQEEWQAAMLAAIPGEWRGRVERMHAGKIGATSDELRAGNLWLLGLAERVGAWRVPLGASEHELCDLAKTKARDCMGLAETTHGARALRLKMADFVARHDLTPPRDDLLQFVDLETGEMITEQRGIEDAPAIRRMTDHLWWRRGLRKAQSRAVEAEAIRLGYVHKQAELYASDLTVTRRQQQKRRNLKSLQDTVALNTETKQEFTLYELAARSVANPEIRRGELMTRIAGFDAVARALGHAREFWTGTCPSEYHAKETNGRGWVFDNKKYTGKTPRDGRDYLARVWSRFRAWAERHGLPFYGFRIAEPHHDGTPHWHLLIFSERRAMPRLRAKFRRFLLQREGVKAPRVKDLREAARKAGAKGAAVKAWASAMLHAWRVDTRHRENADKGRRQHAADFEAIREGESAAGYVAKYVSKNIDGYRVQFDLEGDDYSAVIGAQRVEAWAAAWGIRQFQQVGGAPVGIWRELRRIEKAAVEVCGEAMAAAHAATNKTDDKGADFGAYLQAMGGPLVKRKDLPLTLAKTEAGTKWNRAAEQPLPCPLNRYGEETPPAVYGVREEGRRGRVFVSRRYSWEIKRGTNGRNSRNDCMPTKKGVESIGECEAEKVGEKAPTGSVFCSKVGRPAKPAGPWSPVNNCTRGKNGATVSIDTCTGADLETSHRRRAERPARTAAAGAYPADFQGPGRTVRRNGATDRP